MAFSIPVECPHCLNLNEVEVDNIGQLVQCANCGQAFEAQAHVEEEDHATMKPQIAGTQPAPTDAAAKRRSGLDTYVTNHNPDRLHDMFINWGIRRLSFICIAIAVTLFFTFYGFQKERLEKGFAKVQVGMTRTEVLSVMPGSPERRTLKDGTERLVWDVTFNKTISSYGGPSHTVQAVNRYMVFIKSDKVVKRLRKTQTVR